MNSLNPHQAVVLFDEFGTPTFGDKRESDTFLGVGVVYTLAEEANIVEACNDVFGLSNDKPLKNRRIDPLRADQASQLIAKLPIQVTVTSIDLTNADLERVVKRYEEFGNEIRFKKRGISGRPVAQILHSDILDDTLFESIGRYVEVHQQSAAFEVSIDNWYIPVPDVEIALRQRSESLGQKLTELFGELGSQLQVTVSPIELLIEDSERKRIIDVVASVVSRSFLPRDNPKHSALTLQNVLTSNGSTHEDKTSDTIQFLTSAMDEFSRNPGPNR